MDKELIDNLKLFYDRLKSNIVKSEKKIIRNSLLLTLLNTNSNKSLKFLNDSGIEKPDLQLHIIDRLIEKELIRSSDDNPDEFILTVNGIWEFEKETMKFNEKILLEYFQNGKNFSNIKKSLIDRDKVILLSMIGVRNFSSESPMDLKENVFLDSWLEIFKASYDFLSKNKFIKKDPKLLTYKGNEHPISFLMRRANDLPKKSNNIFCFSKNREYYLDIVVNTKNEVIKDRLEKLLKSIFPKIERIEIMDEINKFLIFLASEKGKFVRKNFKYIEIKYDNLIEESLRNVFLD